MTVSHPLPDDLVELIAERFRALSEPTRIKLLDRLREGEATVLELTELTGTTQQNVSKHLGVLQRAAIVARRKQGNFAHYEPLVTTMQANVDNYKQVNSLPDFRLFTVFFVLPGALLVLLAGAGLFGGRLATRISFHHHARPTPA
jgi:DNA-binding transcriptional ArsR family regulator